LVTLLALLVLPACASGPRRGVESAVPAPIPPPPPPPRSGPGGTTLQDQISGTTQRLQAVSVVNSRVVWASGTGGTFTLSTDGGATWHASVVPAADSLQFRDVEAFDAKTAYLLSAGTGANSRIYKTVDGGRNWQLQFINRDTLAFYDCFAFWDRSHGLAWSDNVGGRFPYQTTQNGGETWTLNTLDGATPGEGAFAASGTCVITRGAREAFVATGAGTSSHILHSTDRGATWRWITTPMVQGRPSTGHTTITFRDDRHGLAAGGDITADAPSTDNVITTQDGGLTWAVAGRPTFPGPVYGAVYVPGTEAMVVAVGPFGASWSRDDGHTWMPIDSLSYWSVAFAARDAGWLVGPGGRITRITLP
jgi:photosystem II stability/assembly factor-like uncharacterized protein